METARDIALIVLVVEALVLGLAVLVAGVAGSIAIIELTVHVRRGLRRAAESAERVSQQVDDFAETRVVAPVVKYERARAAIGTFIDHLLHGPSPSPPTPRVTPER